MLAAVVENPGKLIIKDIPEPTITDYQALVKIEACCICNSTDTKLIEGVTPWSVGEWTPWSAQYPGILGHESVGTVIETGSKVRNFKIGDRVLRVMAKAAGYASIFGGFCETGVITDKKAAREDKAETDPELFHPGQQIVPKSMDPVSATQLITLKETLSFLHRMKLKSGMSLLIMGTGPVGLSFTYLAREAIGANPIIILGRRDEALRRAQIFGAHFTANNSTGRVLELVKKYCPKGVRLVIDAVGDIDLMRLGLEAAGEEGRLAVYGIGEKNEEFEQIMNDKRILQVYPEESEVHEEVLALVRENRIDPSRFVTHVLPLKEISKGFELIKNKQAIKVVIKM